MTDSPSTPNKAQFSQALAALNRIGQTLVAIQDLQETLKQIVRSAKEVLNADIVDLYEYVQARNEFILPPILFGERRHPFVPKEKIYEDDVVVKIVKSGKPRYYPDACGTALLTGEFIVPRTDAPEQRFVVRERVVSSASLPLMAGAETVGVMFINYRAKQLFDEEQKNLIEAFSNLAAIAISNARLYKSEHERRLLYETLQETARKVNESLSPKEVSELALEQLGKVIEYSSASVQLFEGNHRKLLSVKTSRQIPDAPELHRDITVDPLINYIVQNRQPRVLGDVDTEPLWEKLPQTEHIKSWIGVPLIAKGEVIGLLTVDHADVGYYTPERGNVVTAFASQLAVAMHNSIQAQALAKLSQLSEHLISLSEKHEDSRNLLTEIAQGAREVLRADLIELYEYSQAKQAYELPQISVGERRYPLVPKEKIYEDDALMKLLHHTEPYYVERSQGEVTITGDYTVERKDKPTGRFVIREGIQSTAAIPLKSGDELVGLMFANYRTPQKFGGEQKELIELFASQAAIAIHNARLYKALDVLGKIGEQLTANIRLQEKEILALVHQQAGKLMDANNMYIALYDEKTDTISFGLAFQEGNPINVASRKIDDAKRGRTEEIIRTKQPIFIPTCEESKKWYQQPGHAEFVGKISTSWIGVPMMVRQKVIGVIATYHPEKDNVYSKDDMNILQAMADQAAIALDNSRTFDALVEFGQKVSVEIGLQENEILSLIYEQASKLMDTDNMYIALYDEKADIINFGLALQEGSPITVPSRKIDDTKRGRTEEIIRTKQPIFIPTLEKSKKWYQQPGRAEFTGNTWASWIGVPMKVEDKILGVVATYHPNLDHVYSEGDMRILQSMANIAAVAIKNARLYQILERANEKIAETEAVVIRTTIAADFVHHLNNLAGTIPIWVDRIRNYMKSAKPQNEEMMSYVEKYLKKIDLDTEHLLREGEQLKSPPKIELIRVDEVLGSLARQALVQMPAKIEIYFDQQPLPPIRAVTTELNNALWCVIENGIDAMPDGGLLEIVTATCKDSDDEQWINIQIKDQGRGIPKEEQSKIFLPFHSTKQGHMGYGLWRTRNIIERLGGNITFESAEKAGTVFFINLPTQEG